MEAYKIHYTLKDGSEDWVLLRGETIKSIQEKASYHLLRVGGIEPWSEEVPKNQISSEGKNND